MELDRIVVESSLRQCRALISQITEIVKANKHQAIKVKINADWQGGQIISTEPPLVSVITDRTPFVHRFNLEQILEWNPEFLLKKEVAHAAAS